MKIAFDGDAFFAYVERQAQDKKTFKKINALIKDIDRNGPLEGIGKPERLKYRAAPTYSRRIDEANRLVYLYSEEEDIITIISCVGHYEP